MIKTIVEITENNNAVVLEIGSINSGFNQQVFEEPKNLDFYDAITKSNFRTKTGPYFDRIRKNKAGGGLLKQAGDRSGAPPVSGPNSQGLQGLLNRVKKT